MNNDAMPEIILRLGRKHPLIGGFVFLFEDGTLSKEAALVKMVLTLHENSRYDNAWLGILRRAIETGDIKKARDAMHTSGLSLCDWDREDSPPETTA